MSTAALRCAVAAAERDDPQVGTAPPAAQWLLLEHPGPWPVDAVAGSGIAPDVLGPLTRTAAAHATRILLVRRPGRAPSDAAPRRWWLAGPGRGVVSGTWVVDTDLLDAAGALAGPAPVASDPGPLLLVCAHGVHDACCAVRGRPVAAALAARWPGRVWECSHVGGDRFAPNVVVLPDGFYYGGLALGDAVSTVEAHLAGAVRTPHLRGMARYPPVQQAAVVAALDRLGPLGPDDVTVATASTADGRTRVELRVAGRAAAVRVDVATHVQPAARLTCRAVRDTSAAVHRVVGFDAG